MSEKTDRVINEFVNGVYAMLGDRVKKIILYGSYARGDYNEHSDIDIMILTDLTNDEILEYRTKVSDFAYDIELENNVMFSPLIKNIDRFNYWLDVQPFYQNVLREGVVMYG